MFGMHVWGAEASLDDLMLAQACAFYRLQAGRLLLQDDHADERKVGDR